MSCIANRAYRLLSATGTSQDAALMSAGPANLCRISGYNARASAVYLKIYNKASTPVVGTDTPALTFYLPASLSFNFRVDYRGFNGLGIGLTTAAADNSTASVTAGDILGLNILIG